MRISIQGPRSISSVPLEHALIDCLKMKFPTKSGILNKVVNRYETTDLWASIGQVSGYDEDVKGVLDTDVLYVLFHKNCQK